MVWEPTRRGKVIHEPNTYPMPAEEERTARGAEDSNSTPASYNFDFVYAKLRPFSG